MTLEIDRILRSGIQREEYYLVFYDIVGFLSAFAEVIDERVSDVMYSKRCTSLEDPGGPLDEMAKVVCPALMRGLASVDGVLVSLCQNCLKNKLFFSFKTTSEARMKMLTKSGFRTMKGLILGTSVLEPNTVMLNKVDDRTGKKTGIIVNPQRAACVNTAVLLRMLSHRGLVSDEAGQVSVSELGLKLIQRGIMPMALEIMKDRDEKMVASAVNILGELTRAKDIRTLLLMEERNRVSDGKKSLLLELMENETPAVAGAFFLLVCHLQWDYEWQPIILSKELEPPLEVFVAKWLATSIIKVDKDTRQKQLIFKVHQGVTRECIRKKKPIPAGIRPFDDSVIVDYNFLRDGMFYPYPSQEGGCHVFNLLSSSMLVTAHLTPLHTSGISILERNEACRITEYLACIFDMNGSDGGGRASGLLSLYRLQVVT